MYTHTHISQHLVSKVKGYNSYNTVLSKVITQKFVRKQSVSMPIVVVKDWEGYVISIQ